MLLDIVILPPPKLREQLGKKTKQAVKGYPHVFVVDNKKFIPHASLFHLNTSRQELEKIESIVNRISREFKPTKIRNLRFQKHEHSVGFELSNNPTLQKLNRDIVNNLYRLRTGEMPWSPSRPPTKLEKKRREKYGTQWNVEGYFHPHFTMARFKNPNDGQEVVKKMSSIKFDFLADTIAICEVNFYHQVTRVIKEFKLGDQISEAVKVLKAGGIVVYPTDTSYGLAVDATNARAVKKLYQLKGRNFKKPIHVIAPWADYHTIVYDSAPARKLVKKFWPGPLTLVLPLKAKGKSWQMLSAGTGTLGIRYPAHQTPQALVGVFGKPITTTSANIAGLGDTYSIDEVKKQFGNNHDFNIYYLNGGKLKKTKSSTVLSLIGHAKILRPGPITETQIKKALKV